MALTPGHLVARTGRHQQRYENGIRLVAGCIPFRTSLIKSNDSAEIMIEVMMITSQHGEGLLFPKGGWETDETVEEAACREAIEEAGVKGLLQGKVGSYQFKSKRLRSAVCSEGACQAHVFLLNVTQELDVWPEKHSRLRQWLSLPDAIKKCRHDWMKDALETCHHLLRDGARNSHPNPI